MTALSGVDRPPRSVLKLSLPNSVSDSSIVFPSGILRTVNVVPSSLVRGAAGIEVEELRLAGVLVVVVVTSAAALVHCIGY